MKLPLIQAAALALLCPLVSGQEIKLLPNAHHPDRFGGSVAISDTTAIIGARGSCLQGAVHSFDTTTGEGGPIDGMWGWASDSACNDGFSRSVAISGNTAFGGAPYHDGCIANQDPSCHHGGSNSGSAYRFDTTTGVETAELYKGGFGYNEYFGCSVAISGNTVIVGAYGDDENGYPDSGAAYIFDVTSSGSSWTYKLLASDGPYPHQNANDYRKDNFGYSVAISGNTAVIGAPYDNENGIGSGCAYIFDTATGVQVAKLLAGDGGFNENFGYSVAISGNTAVIGAPYDNENGIGSGCAYIFDTTTGVQVAKLLADDGEIDDNFGLSVAISGNTAVVGAPYGNGIDSGSAYIFDATTGVQLVKLLASDGAYDDRFGWSVDISGGTFIVGAPYDDDIGQDTGSAYLMVPLDCNGNGIIDSYDIAGGSSADCDSDGVPDDCQLARNDCNRDGVPDNCEVDCDNDMVPDSCQTFSEAEDCNTNGIPDICDIASGTEDDANENGVPDSCQSSSSSGGGGCGVMPASGPPLFTDFLEHYAPLLLLLAAGRFIQRRRRRAPIAC